MTSADQASHSRPIIVRRIVGSTPTPTTGWWVHYDDGTALPVAAFGLAQTGEAIHYPDQNLTSYQRCHKHVDGEPRTELVALVQLPGDVALSIPDPDTFSSLERDDT
jgi:hypothetical protein